ncbi:MAG: hypothetical protein ACRBF0_04865, partial [Calditrichia bacterium]
MNQKSQNSDKHVDIGKDAQNSPIISGDSNQFESHNHIHNYNTPPQAPAPAPKSLKNHSTFREFRETLVRFILDIFRRKERPYRFTLFTIVGSILFHPAVTPKVFANIFFHSDVIWEHYRIVWLVAVMVSSVTVVLLLSNQLARNRKKSVETFLESRAIKGLRPFTMEDADLFSELQRKESLEECIQALVHPDFRLGVLYADSGCGKTSFLQAGIQPAISKPQASYLCLYVKVSDEYPSLTLAKELANNGFNIAESDEQDIIQGLDTFGKLNEKVFVILLDQFEQFFVHFPRSSEQQDFINILDNWLQKSESSNVKLLFSIRGDYIHKILRVLKALNFSIGPQENFQLEKFSPEEAAKIFEVIANNSDLSFNKSFVESMCAEELASQLDGTISPVDIQILSWMIYCSKSESERGFTQSIYERLGGIEGLLENYLSKALDMSGGEIERDISLKVLISLTDLDGDVRAGILTQGEIQQKLGHAFELENIAQQLSWLSSSKVRLITPSKRNNETAFELAHERLIPAIRRLANKELTEVDQTNRLLDRRLNEWIGNNKHSRYLLTWSELRLIKRLTPFITWGKRKQQKLSLVSASKLKIRMLLSPVIMLIIASIATWIWLKSDIGRNYIIEQSLVQAYDQISTNGPHKDIVRAFITNKDFDAAIQYITRIPTQTSKTKALIYYSNATLILGKHTHDKSTTDLILQVMRLTEGMDLESDRSMVFRSIASAAATLGDSLQHKKAFAILESLIPVTNKWESEEYKYRVFRSIASAAATLGDSLQHKKAFAILESLIPVTNKWESEGYKYRVFQSIASAAA